MKLLIRKAALVAALTVGLGFQVAGNAASLGTLSGTYPFTTTTVNGSFDDLYTFSVTPNAGAIFASTAVTFATYGANVSGLSVYLGSYSTPAALVGLIPITAGNTYTLEVKGSSLGASAYTTVIALQAVPEPESYAMLAAGLGMMGFIARRRSRKNG